MTSQVVVAGRRQPVPTGRRLALVTVLGAMGLAACGSTVPVAERSRSTDGLGLTPGRGSTGQVTSPITPGGSLPGTAGGTATGPDESLLPGEGASDGTATASEGQRATGGEKQPETVQVGFVYFGDMNQSLSALGFGALVTADPGKTYAALVNYLNKHGGLGGRKIRPVYHSQDSQSTVPYAVQNQAACTDLTQDHKVQFIVVSTGTGEPRDLTACAKRANIVLINSSTAGGGGSFLEANRMHYYAPASIDTITAGRTLVDVMAQQKFFKPTGRIGILHIDTVGFREGVEKGIKPALAARGLKAVDTIAINYGGQTSDAGNTAAQIQSAELRFSAELIDEVVILEAGGGIAQFFMTDAGSQGYYPAYALTSGDDPGAILESFARDSGQLEKSMGIGWFPRVDLGTAPLPPANAAETLCQAIMRAEGLGSTSRTVQVGQDIACGELFFLRDVVARAGRTDVTRFRHGVDLLTRPFPAAAGFQDAFGPGRNHGAVSVRAFAYASGCQCFRYTSGLLPVRR